MVPELLAALSTSELMIFVCPLKTTTGGLAREYSIHICRCFAIFRPKLSHAIQVGLADKILSTGRPSDVTTIVEICAIRTLSGTHISAFMRKLIHSIQIMTFVVSAPGRRLKETPGEERSDALYGHVGESGTHSSY